MSLFFDALKKLLVRLCAQTHIFGAVDGGQYGPVAHWATHTQWSISSANEDRNTKLF